MATCAATRNAGRRRALSNFKSFLWPRNDPIGACHVEAAELHETGARILSVFLRPGPFCTSAHRLIISSVIRGSLVRLEVSQPEPTDESRMTTREAARSLPRHGERAREWLRYRLPIPPRGTCPPTVHLADPTGLRHIKSPRDNPHLRGSNWVEKALAGTVSRYPRPMT